MWNISQYVEFNLESGNVNSFIRWLCESCRFSVCLIVSKIIQSHSQIQVECSPNLLSGSKNRLFNYGDVLGSGGTLTLEGGALPLHITIVLVLVILCTYFEVESSPTADDSSDLPPGAARMRFSGSCSNPADSLQGAVFNLLVQLVRLTQNSDKIDVFLKSWLHFSPLASTHNPSGQLWAMGSSLHSFPCCFSTFSDRN